MAAGAAGRRQPCFTGGETCWPGGAGWRRVENRAEECSHAPRQTCRRSELVAKRWRPRNARGASEGAGGRAGARGAGAATGCPNGPRAARANGGEPRAGNERRAAELPTPALPTPELSGALPSPTPEPGPCRAIPGPGAWAHPLAPSRPGRLLPARRIREPRSPRACGLPRAAGGPRRAELDERAPRPPGADRRGGGQGAGPGTAGNREPARRGRGLLACEFKEPEARLAARGDA